MADRPMLHMEPQRVMCQVHGEPFREQWPTGYAVFSLTVIGRALENAELLRVTGGSLQKVDAVLDERPACHWVSADTLMKVYREAGIGKVARCNVCGQNVLGTSFKTQAASYDHLCFGCVIENGETHHQQIVRRVLRREQRRRRRRR